MAHNWKATVNDTMIAARCDDLKFAVVYVEKKGDTSRYRLCPIVNGYVVSVPLLIRYYPNNTSFEEAIRMTEERIETCHLLYMNPGMCGFSWKAGSITITYTSDGTSTRFVVNYDNTVTNIEVLSDLDYETGNGKMTPVHVTVNDIEVESFKKAAVA